MIKLNYKVYTLDQVADILQFNIERVIELVVNGKIPVFNRDLGHFVEKVENDNETKKEEEKIATEILMNKSDVVNIIDYDLPF